MCALWKQQIPALKLLHLPALGMQVIVATVEAVEGSSNLAESSALSEKQLNRQPKRIKTQLKLNNTETYDAIKNNKRSEINQFEKM